MDKKLEDIVLTDTDFDPETIEELYDGSVEEVEEQDIVLEFIDDLPWGMTYGDCELEADSVFEEFSPEEILDLNEVSMEEVITLMYYSGNIGLPKVIEDEEETEEEQDLSEED